MLRRVMMAVSNGGGAYLDGLPQQPQMVLSLRKLISTASVSIRVRRSSDNAEQDIGFSGDALDIASLAVFVGAGSAYVTRMYDQTGNGEHAEQGAPASQPRIVTSGSYDGRLLFDAVDDLLKVTSLTAGSTAVGVYSRMAASTVDSSIMLETGVGNPSGIQGAWDVINPAGSGILEARFNTNAFTSLRSNAFTPLAGVMQQFSILLNSALSGVDEVKCWIDGDAKSPVPNESYEQSGSFSTRDLHIGARGNTTAPSDMMLETLVIYNGDTSMIRPDIEGIIS